MAGSLNLSKFIGIPFVHGGREFTGADCYGLLILYYQYISDLYNLDAPQLMDYIYKKRWYENTNLYLDEYAKQFTKIEQPELHCVVLMKMSKFNVPNHAAIYIGNGQILQIMEKHNSGIYKLEQFKHFIHSYYRWKYLELLVEDSWRN